MQILFKKLKQFYDSHSGLLKMIFIFSVLIFVFTEIGKIFNQLNWNQVELALSDQSFSNIIFMLVGGIISILPMLIYDFIIVQFLPGKFSIFYIIRSGWITNTFNNVMGFGGLIGAALRANFYKKGATKKEILYAVSKIVLFLLSGLSIFCWVSIFILFLNSSDAFFHKYWIWLLGGGMYFPILFIFTKLKNNVFFKDLNLKLESSLLVGSTIEWAFSITFFIFIGHLMNVSINLISIIPLYIIAEILGILSMVPGGLGSFDVFMILELMKIGVSSGIAIVWILFFRLFYYIIPFLLGLLFFIHDMGHQLNKKLNGIPRTIIQKLAHDLVTVFMYFSGIFMLLESAVPNFTFSNSFLMHLMPYTFFFLSQMTNIIFAFMLIGMGRIIRLKATKAYIPTLVILCIGVVNTLWREYTPKLAIFLIFVMICIILSRKELYRKKIQISFGNSLFSMSIYGITFLTYMLIGFLNIPHKHYKHLLPSGLLFPGIQVWLYGFVGMIFAGIILIAIDYYFTNGKDPFNMSKFSESRIKNIINKYGGNEVSHLAYLNDKMIYIFRKNDEDQLFIMYKIKAEKIIIMGEPVGNQKFLKDAINEIMRLSDEYGYHLVFYEINSKLTMLLHEFGFDFIKMGEEGFVNLEKFTLSGKKQRAQRALMNKFERENYTFSIVNPPFSDNFINELKSVSDSWLGSRSEKGFSLGFFDIHYINAAPVCVIKNTNEKIVAFATLMPMERDILSVDLMRYSREAPSGIMDKIFIELFNYGKVHNYKYFDMGMAPLSNVGISQYSFIEERIAHFIYEYGYNIYGFQGLRAYKGKYASIWQSKYTTYHKRSSIIITMFQIMMVVNQKRNNDEKIASNILLPNFFQH